MGRLFVDRKYLTTDKAKGEDCINAKVQENYRNKKPNEGFKPKEMDNSRIVWHSV